LSSAFPSLALLLALTASVSAGELKVCADPNNMPFSNRREEGFENRIVRLVAADLGDTLTYVWWAQRRGYIGEALNSGACDLVPGLANVGGLLLTYPPYYRSGYVAVSRAAAPPIASFDDPLLRSLRIGIELIGDDGANTPPAAALARRGIVYNIRGYPVIGDYGTPNPPARVIDAVVDGEVDVALAWGPMSGYFAWQHGLRVTPLVGTAGGDLPMAFDISMGLRLDQGVLRKRVEEALVRHKAEIDAILSEYSVPRLDNVEVSR
jgi:mxaJ protein